MINLSGKEDLIK